MAGIDRPAEVGSEPDEAVLVRRSGGICVIRLNREARRNSIDAETARAVGEALETADRDPEVRAIVVTGTGTRAFCAGADLAAVARGEAVIPRDRREWGFAGITRHPLVTPLIAAVNGVALGGGLEIVLACDIAIASTNAAFGLPEVRVGQLATAGGLFRLTRQVPPKVAAEMLLTGEMIGPELALRWGLVSRVVEPERLVQEAMSIAGSIAANAPLSVQASRRVLRAVVGGEVPDDARGWEATDAERRTLRGTHDSVEGARAFAEKREPRWLGR
jgi:crotonobetainyl-CoA hydratase